MAGVLGESADPKEVAESQSGANGEATNTQNFAFDAKREEKPSVEAPVEQVQKETKPTEEMQTKVAPVEETPVKAREQAVPRQAPLQGIK